MAGKIVDCPELAGTWVFAPGVKAGPLVYVSGTAVNDPSLDCRQQSEKVFENISKVLAQVGYSMRDVVKIDAFISSREDYPAYNEARHKYFPQDPPAATTVVTELMVPGMKVEVDAVAYKE